MVDGVAVSVCPEPCSRPVHLPRLLPAMNAPATSRAIKVPSSRRSVVHKFSLAGFTGYLIVGMSEDGRPAEIFVKIAKEGSTLSGLMASFCKAFSMALQYGLPLEKAISKFRGVSFEPRGMTDNPEIPEADSLVDYIVRFIALNWRQEKTDSANET